MAQIMLYLEKVERNLRFPLAQHINNAIITAKLK